MSSLIVKTALVHCWWECKLVQPLWNTVWNFLKNIKIKLPYDPAVPFLAVYPKEALCSIFTIANAWKQPKCSPVDVCVCTWAHLVSQLCPTLFDPMDYSLPGSSIHGNSPGKNTGVGCHTLLQGFFRTQGLNLGFLHCRQILYHLSHQGSFKF